MGLVPALLAFACVAHAAFGPMREPSPVAAEMLAALPLAFERNDGQSAPHVRFVARGAAYDTLLSDRGAEIVVGRPSGRVAVIGIRVADQRAPVAPEGASPLPGKANYLVGADPGGHIVGVDTFARVEYRSVLRGVDLVYYGTQGRLEFDLIVAPGSDPHAIRLDFLGVDRIDLSEGGDLVVHTSAGPLELRRPVAYQDIAGERRIVDAAFVHAGARQVGLRIGRYDREHPLVIDPILSLASNLWGAASGVALDAEGNIYVAGTTWTSGLPAGGGYQTRLAGSQDAYVAKLNRSGTAVAWTTYLGARRAATSAAAIAVDGAGSAYLTGATDGSSFPITPGALQATGPAFVTKLAPAGNALAYSTRFGAPVAAIAVDAEGNAFLTGTTSMLTTTPGALQPAKLAPSSPYVAKLGPAGNALVYATYLGGSANDEARAIAIDGAGNAYVTGVARSVDFPVRNALRPALAGASDAFVAKLDPKGSALAYSTYLGGSADERAFGVAVDAAGQAAVVGWTRSNDFPVTANAFQRSKGHPDAAVSNAFVVRLDATGSTPRYASYLGGRWCLSAASSCFGLFGPDDGIDAATSVAIDQAGFIYLGGYATSDDFPLVDRIQNVGAGSEVQRVAFVAKLNPDGAAPVYSVVLGPRTSATYTSQVAVDGSGGVVAVGNSWDPQFPLTAGAVRGDSSAFLFKLETGVHPTTLRASSNPSAPGQPITLTAGVLNPAPGGIVTFRTDTSTLGSVPASSGTATLSLALPAGIHRITATNSADGKGSPPHFQVVTAP
jgi:hypothetical protein